MQTIKLSNKLEMPIIGFGTWRITNDQAGVDLVKQALELGYRMIDTAAMYDNEAAVGQAVRDSGLSRSEIFVVTKVWVDDFGYAATLKAYESSLKRLGLDYADLYLIHHPTTDSESYIQSWRALERLYRERRVKSIGVSNFWPNNLEKLRQRDLMTPHVNQIKISPFLQQLPTREYCLRHNIAIQSYSPLDRGGSLLDDKLIRKLAAKYNRSPAQIVLRWHIDSGLVPLPKSANLDRIAENHDIDFKIKDDDMVAIAKLDQGPRA
ncbi:MAG TPA: aldo/keto reductase [Candidatus Saccharimonadales bacterium]|nr:aldo/keto reductase [Candidatus Saccharimonadales bacterium]